MKSLSLKNCQICYCKTTTVLDLGCHPLCDDLIKIKSKKINKEYPIIIQYCKNCKTAFNKIQIKKKILFPKNYHYRARFTEDVIKGQKKIVKRVKKLLGSLRGLKVLDIGCNDGTLLDLFKIEKAITIGVEPTNASKDASKSHKIYNCFLNKNVTKKIKKTFKNIDIITFTNVFAHINNLDEVISCIKQLISEKTILLIENHYLGSVLEKKQFDTFYHEHPRTYSLTSFLAIAKKIGLNLESYTFPKRYGGNIQVIMSKKKKKNNFKKVLSYEKSFFKKFKKLKEQISIWKKIKKNKIIELNKKFGPLPAKAFPGRAAILLKLLNINENHISAIYEKDNSKKIGYYVPATKIPIISDKNLIGVKKNLPIINLAWHIEKEIKKYLKDKNIFNKVVPILNNRDFYINK